MGSDDQLQRQAGLQLPLSVYLLQQSTFTVSISVRSTVPVGADLEQCLLKNTRTSMMCTYAAMPLPESASSRTCPLQQPGSSLLPNSDSASMPEATSPQCPSGESRDSTNATCHAVPKSSATVPLIMDALPEQSLFEEAANLMLRASATSSESLGTCSKIQETNSKASTSTRSHEPSLILP
ncbi:hypothetical protein V5799_024658 [Amblyomma americanum]|uniref:Uncharacterized protein n=1 Tax=Amblyomma americanum TaxID=6943 RepID=A0AAQ4EBF4_AMBAM